MRKILLVVPFLFLYFAPLRSQVMFGPEVGVNAGIFKLNLRFLGTSTISDPALIVGGVVDFSLGDRLDLRTGLRYTSTNYTLAYVVFSLKTTINTIQLPINLEYAIGMGQHSKFYVGGGPYLSLNTLAREHISVDTAIARTFGISPVIDSIHNLSAMDFGVTLKAGGKFGDHFFAEGYFQKGLGYMLLDIQELEIRNYMFGITVGYLFGRGREPGYGGGYR